ncbi:unnamed protein product [Dracunculus medinensis]|uniref:CWF19-like protein 1 n=1 Tax=Dracunculus medinensis TaxID=318479 RepID=A0A0N4U138_DRAME|nr:unnamed protein product [Dracunculus medinensis]
MDQFFYRCLRGKSHQMLGNYITNGPFEFFLCVGEFFGVDEKINSKVMNGDIEFPITTYILVLGPCSPSTSTCYPEGRTEFSPNLIYLGKRGILNTISGLQIGYLSGIESEKASDFEFDKNSVDELLAPVKVGSFTGIDILLTSMWPAQVAKYSPNQPSVEISGSPLISRLASGLKPRYHFAGMGAHYERTPYRNHRVLMELAQHVTRFIGLAPVNNPEKHKWLYAFSITPMRNMSRVNLAAQPSNTSEFPYMELISQMAIHDQIINKQKRHQHQYFFDMSDQQHEVSPYKKRRKKNGRLQDIEQFDPQSCWFCLSNPSFQKHLVVSVSTHSYIAMPKDHIQSIVASSNELREDIQKFKDSLTLMFNKKNMVPVFFERNFKTQHLQINVVPVPKSCSKALRISFINSSNLKNLNMVFLKKDQQIWDMVNEGCPYFYLELPDGTRMFSLKMQNFSLQYAREVLAERQLLNCEEKVNWRSCELNKRQEEELVADLKKSFKPYDFTDDDDGN